jgi:hypothetical protein
MLRRVPAEADPAAAAAGGASVAAALEPQRPRHAERRRRCRLSLKNGQVVGATPAGFGPTIEAVASAHTATSLADTPLAGSPLRNADEIRGQIGVVERGSVSFVEKGVPLVVSSRNQCCWRIGGATLCSQSGDYRLCRCA